MVTSLSLGGLVKARIPHGGVLRLEAVGDGTARPYPSGVDRLRGEARRAQLIGCGRSVRRGAARAATIVPARQRGWKCTKRLSPWDGGRGILHVERVGDSKLPRGWVRHTTSHSVRSDYRECASMFRRIDGLDLPSEKEPSTAPHPWAHGGQAAGSAKKRTRRVALDSTGTKETGGAAHRALATLRKV
jgi:hypothetical protein